MIKRRNIHHPWLRHRSVRGFTLTELMISSFITLLVMLAVVSLQYLSARCVKEIYGQTTTRSSRMIALDQIRYRLCNARIGSASVSQSDHRIEFIDPNLGGQTSAFLFNETNDTLFYDDDINDADGPIKVVTGPIDITFASEGAGEIIKVRVRSASDMIYGNVDVQDGETAVYLRNT